jgi:MFS family permease
VAARPAGDRGRWPRPAGWLRAGAAVGTVGWGANQFTPLLLLYRPRLGLSAAVVQATFGMYALGLMPGLLVAGRVSDRVGRRPVLRLAVVLSMVAGAVLALGGYGVGWLFAGRLVMGVAAGAAFSAGSAWMKELSTPPFGTAAAGAGARRAGIAMTLGFALGPLVAGVLAQWAPAPTALPYLPQLALAAAALPLLAGTPETVHRAAGADRELRLPGLRERRFRLVVLPLAPWVFGAAAVAMAYAPPLVGDRVRGLAVFFGALTALCTALSGALVQPLARRLDRPGGPRLLTAGLSLIIAGLLAEAVVAATRQPALVLVAGAVLGCGYGVCLVYALAEVQRLARPTELAGLTAVAQAAMYVGFGLPYLLALLRPVAPPAGLLLGTAALAALTLAGTVRQARR